MQSQGAAADLQSVERVVFRRLVIFLRGVAVILLPCGHRGLWFCVPVLWSFGHRNKTLAA